MRIAKLLPSVAAALLLSAGAVFAQGTSREAPERAPEAQQNAPAEKIAPPMKRDGERDKQDATDTEPFDAATGKSDSRPKTEQNRAATTGQGGAAGAAKLSTEQRTKLTAVIRQNKVEPTKLDVTVSVGTRVPEGVRLHPLPEKAIEIYPGWRGFEYILADDRIVVIDPRTHEIIAILDA